MTRRINDDPLEAPALLELGGCKTKGTNLVHVGAHMGQESASYRKLGISHVIWIEGNPRVFETLQKTSRTMSGLNTCWLGLLSESDDADRCLYVTNRGTFSSILIPTDRARGYWPDIEVVEALRCPTMKLDSMLAIAEFEIDRAFQTLIVDVQGAELYVLKGATNFLAKWAHQVVAEIYTEELYEGCPLEEDVSAWMWDQGFALSRMSTCRKAWGNALYIRRRELTLRANRFWEEYNRKAKEWGLTEMHKS